MARIHSNDGRHVVEVTDAKGTYYYVGDDMGEVVTNGTTDREAAIRYVDTDWTIELDDGSTLDNAPDFDEIPLTSSGERASDANDLLAYAETEIKRLGLGDTPTNVHGVVATAEGGGVRLSDGVGLDETCADRGDVDAALADVAAWYSQSKSLA